MHPRALERTRSRLQLSSWSASSSGKQIASEPEENAAIVARALSKQRQGHTRAQEEADLLHGTECDVPCVQRVFTAISASESLDRFAFAAPPLPSSSSS